VAVSQQH